MRMPHERKMMVVVYIVRLALHVRYGKDDPFAAVVVEAEGDYALRATGVTFDDALADASAFFKPACLCAAHATPVAAEERRDVGLVQRKPVNGKWSVGCHVDRCSRVGHFFRFCHVTLRK